MVVNAVLCVPVCLVTECMAEQQSAVRADHRATCADDDICSLSWRHEPPSACCGDGTVVVMQRYEVSRSLRTDHRLRDMRSDVKQFNS